MMTLLFYSLIGGLFSLVGAFVLLWRADLAKKVMTSLLAFAAGAFLGVAFLDLLPEAIETGADPHSVFVAALVGFVFFFVLERGIMKFHPHAKHHTDIGDEHPGHSEHTEPLPALIVIGDIFHNFLDGVVIALAYIANPVIGLVATLGVAAHEIPQEVGDAGVLLSQGWSKKKIIWVNVLQSLATIPGVLVGYYGGMRLEPVLPMLLAGVSGIFFYIAASDLIPEIHHRTGHKHFYRVVIPLVASMIILGYLVSIAHA